jgi:signal transduction histidine kinase
MAELSAAPRAPRMAVPFFRWSIGIAFAMVAGALVFELFDASVFKRIGMAHEFCYLREPRLIWLHVTSDVLIGAAYVSISATLGYLVYKASRDIPFNWVFLAFGLFIVSCGLTHFMEVWVIWEPVYWMSGYVKVVTAAASVATAVALFPLLPKVFRLIEDARQSARRRVEIEQLNGELERFNYSVAHDLRAPLRGINGFGQALREDFADQLPPQARDYIEKMQRSATQMDTLISDLLKYATIGRQELNRHPISLDDAFVSAQSLLETEIVSRGAVVRVDSPLPAVIADSSLLQVVILNLLANALKFVAPGVSPLVEVAAQVDEDHVVVTVTDNGLGVPPESREQIFRIFERIHPNLPGTGIGLAIVHRAIERLEGRIGVESAPTGTGTRFWFRLPRG